MASLKGSYHEINQAAATDPECCCQGPLETEPHYSGPEILASGKSKDRFQNLNPGLQSTQWSWTKIHPGFVRTILCRPEW